MLLDIVLGLGRLALLLAVVAFLTYAVGGVKRD
jgi:hypothetical protein